MLEAFIQGASVWLQPALLLLMFVGVVIGLIIGIMPAIGPMFALAVLLPFVFRMPPEQALGFLVAMAAVTYTGGSITTILLGIPGTGANVATVLDGFPMTQKGEGARAVGAGISSSMFGGIVAVVMALVMIPLLIPVVMAFRTPEMALIIILGLAFMATLSQAARLKGLISGFLGVMLALVGTHVTTGTLRFTFGKIFLYEGLEMIAVVLGLFGLASLIDVLVTGQAALSRATVAPKFADIFQGAMDVWRHRWLWFRSSLIGYIVGVIPGIGAQVAIWTAYGQAKQTSKHPEEFGKGCVEGVIAPESANNAKEAGGLLTTMVFGIPGTPEMAIMIGAFFMVGVMPGRQMVEQHLPLVFTLLVGIAIANFIAGLFCFGAVPYLAKVARVPIQILFALVLLVVFAAAYSTKTSMANALVVALFGVLGFLMMRFGYSRASLVLGFVLGELLEQYLFQSIKIHGPFFFVTPISLALIAILVLLFTYPYLKRLIRHSPQKEGKTA